MKVYIVVDNDSTEDDVTVKAFSTKEKAIDYIAELKEKYLKEYPYYKLEEDEKSLFTMQYYDWTHTIEVYMVEEEVDEVEGA